MSVPPSDRDRPAEVVAGYVATAAIFASAIALVHRPLLLSTVSILLAVFAAGIGGRHARLAAFAVAAASAAFVLGMTIAVVANRPLF